MGVSLPDPPDGPDATPDAPGRPTRVPRPGDPFAKAQAAGPAPRPRRPRKKGRIFFMTLLVIGGALVLATTILFFTFRGMTVDFYRDVVLPRGIPESLPPDYPREDAVRLLKSLDAFFARADQGRESDERVIEVISEIEAAMADRRITPEEAEGLIGMAGPRGEGG